MKKDDFLIWLSKIPEDTEFDISGTSIDTYPALITCTIEFSFYEPNIPEIEEF